MHIKNLKIGQKIRLTFAVIILLAVFNGVFNHINLSNSFDVVKTMNESSEPSLEVIRELNQTIRDSRAYITNWVYIKKSQANKESLVNLLDKRYPAIKTQMGKLSQLWESEEEKKLADELLVRFDRMVGLEREVMGMLATETDYEDPLAKLDSEEKLEAEIIPAADSLNLLINGLLESRQQASTDQKVILTDSFSRMQTTAWMLTAMVLVFSLLVSVWLSSSISNPVLALKRAVDKLRMGVVPEKVAIRSRDEVGQMGEAVNDMVEGLKSYSDFARDVGQGNLDSEFEKLGEDDALGISLIDMRNNLRQIAEEDRKRTWAVEGHARFAETLRANTNNIKGLCEGFLTELVKYMEANQGAVFVLDEEREELHLNASFAWDRKKFQEKTLMIGEGLVGQCVLEAETIFLTEIPTDFVSIKSGLGEANPTCLVLVPMKLNDKVHGVIEIASFCEFEPYQIEFLEKLAESVASSISMVKVNEQTQRLLSESQHLAQESKAQEEELRQNQEEMAATQEEAERNLQQAEQEITRLTAENLELKSQPQPATT